MANPGIYTNGLTPSNALYPSNTLYPLSDSVTLVPYSAIVNAYSSISTYWFGQQPSFDAYLSYLRNNVRSAYFKIELLRIKDESIYDTIISDILNADGNVVNSLQEGVRRTCSFSLINALREYTTFFSNISIGNKFKLSLGYEINQKVKWFSQGVFAFDNPAIVSNRSDRTISISGTDKWSFLNGKNGGILDSTFIAPMGNTIGNLIKSILALEVVSDPIEPLIDSRIFNSAITYDITKQTGETAASLILEIAYNLSCYVYYNSDGRLVVRPYEEDYMKYPSYSLKTSDYNLLSLSKELLLDQVYNAVKVIADNTQNSDIPIIAEVINTDLSDPNSLPNYGIKKTYVVTDFTKGISTQTLAADRARWELKNVKAKQSSINAVTLALYHLDVNDIVSISDITTDDIDTRYLINNISLSIGTNIESSVRLVKVGEDLGVVNT